MTVEWLQVRGCFSIHASIDARLRHPFRATVFSPVNDEFGAKGDVYHSKVLIVI
jgi:hypothetical protein